MDAPVRPGRVTIHRGDNLAVMAELAAGSFGLVYTDPPFNTGRTQTRVTLRTTADAAGDRTVVEGNWPAAGDPFWVLARVNADNGDVVWQQQFDCDEIDDYSHELRVTEDGNLLYSGSISGSCVFAGEDIMSAIADGSFTTDGFFGRFSSTDGTMLSYATLPAVMGPEGPIAVEASSADEDANGNLVFAASVNGGSAGAFHYCAEDVGYSVGGLGGLLLGNLRR